jgi:peptidoglycan/xylan/chitin deacetylase (PgdA/CDA1 family)
MINTEATGTDGSGARADGWRAGAAAAMVLTFDVDGEAPLLAEDARHAENEMLMSHQAFGPTVGVPRILGLLAEYDVPATFFVPGVTAERYPRAVEAILEAGHEIGHHSHRHHPYVEMSEPEEREDFDRALEVLTRLGATVTGHRTPLSGASLRTPGLVASHGLSYESTLMDDDRPYILDTGDGDIVELPPSWALDDWLQYVNLPVGESYRIKSPREVAAGWRLELDALRAEGGLVVLTLHPFASGRASRLDALAGLIEHALDAGDVAVLSAAEVARRARADESLPRRALDRLDPRPDPAVYPN